ncbi:hypothetical protein [Bradyrhizobium sp. Leo121]|uniref:hypothetical protein n=1 Tax=Bradyrhizobium sp. Leo121 TaxID=1571195 RepID=UPI00102A1128|nr:hypothetical protein [Bradyrhizobium sp. Leo121]RZN30472.1 hypothetical protein CWO90_20255 [Bradyrhizobium sp. Leo121]
MWIVVASPIAGVALFMFAIGCGALVRCFRVPKETAQFFPVFALTWIFASVLGAIALKFAG